MDISGLLAELVATPTISADAAAQRRVIDMCLAMIRTEHRRVNIEADLDGAHPWAVLTNEAPPQAKRLAFCCHVDTVPTGPPSGWSYPPFGAEVHDGRLMGRGATDMKGGLVAALDAVRYAIDTGVPVALVLTSDEEVGSLGAHRARHAVAGADIRAVIIPEATANGINLGHRGALWLRIATAGVAAHGSTPHLGRNAVLAMMDLVQRARTELPQAEDAYLGRSTWNLGTITGGTAPNIVPAQASCVIDHRTVGNGGQLRQWWTSQVEVDSVESLIDLPAVWTAAEHPWVAGLPVAASGEPVSYFTDASALTSVIPDVPQVIWGPGDPTTMHAVDEGVDLADIAVAGDYYRQVITQWGGDDQGLMR